VVAEGLNHSSRDSCRAHLVLRCGGSSFWHTNDVNVWIPLKNTSANPISNSFNSFKTNHQPIPSTLWCQEDELTSWILPSEFYQYVDAKRMKQTVDEVIDEETNEIHHLHDRATFVIHEDVKLIHRVKGRIVAGPKCEEERYCGVRSLTS